jgi:hypothetical protein
MYPPEIPPTDDGLFFWTNPGILWYTPCRSRLRRERLRLHEAGDILSHTLSDQPVRAAEKVR